MQSCKNVFCEGIVDPANSISDYCASCEDDFTSLLHAPSPEFPVPALSAPAPSGEFDPSGVDPHTPGAKLDGGKIRPTLVLESFSLALIEICGVGTYGANKYTDDGWASVPNGQKRYTDALYRHLLSEHIGEDKDPDTGFHHAAHAAWNALARLELLLRSKKPKE